MGQELSKGHICIQHWVLSHQLCERQAQLVTKVGTLPFSGEQTSFTQSLFMARLGQ